MADTIALELRADNQSLLFTIVNERQWCVVSLKNSEEVELGADTIKPILKRLFEVLRETDLPPEDSAEGRVCLMLYEKHTMGLAFRASSGMKIVLRNGRTQNLISIIHLSEIDIIRWKENLSSYLRS